jgi:hypothetical protein
MNWTFTKDMNEAWRFLVHCIFWLFKFSLKMFCQIFLIKQNSTMDDSFFAYVDFIR